MSNSNLKLKRIFYSIGFFIWPFVTLLVTLKDKDKWLKNILWFFVIFSGYNFTISNYSMDANAYKEIFLIVNKFNFQEFYSYLFLQKEVTLDLVFPFLSFFVSRITDDYQVLFAFMGLVFGFFYSRNVWYVLLRMPKRNSYLIKILFVTFFIIVGFWQINGFRYWTATHIFFYATIPYVFENSKKKLWFLPFAVLTHFSFILPILIIIAYKLTKNKSKSYFYFFVVSLFVAGINLKFLQNNVLNFLPSIFRAKIETYTNLEYVNEVKKSKEALSVIAVIFSKSLPLFINILFVFIGKNYYKYLKENERLFNLFNFSFLFMALSNLFSIIPSMGRFVTMSFMFSLFFLILFFLQKYVSTKFRMLAVILTPLLIGYCFGSLKLAANKIGIITLVGNPLYNFLENLF